MKTDDLIAALARNEDAAPRANWTAAVGVGLLLGVVLMAISIWPRPDLIAAAVPTLAKTVFSAAFAAAGLALAVRLSKPGAPARSQAYFLVALAVGVGAASLVMFAGTPADERMARLLEGDLPWCLVFVPVFAVPAAIAIGRVMRGRAPTNLTLSGAAIGAAAGGIGAMAYALHCPIDGALFVTVWYGLAIALCALIGATLGARLLRW